MEALKILIARFEADPEFEKFYKADSTDSLDEKLTFE